jgi:hypothetical protein
VADKAGIKRLFSASFGKVIYISLKLFFFRSEFDNGFVDDEVSLAFAD